MKYEAELNFAKKLLEHFSLKIDFFDQNTPLENRPPMNRYMHDTLLKMWNHENLLSAMTEHLQPNTIYQLQDIFSCSYLIFQLPDTSESPIFAYIGPYTTTPITKHTVENISERLNLHEKAASLLEQFYFSVPLITDDSMVLTILYTLAEQIWGSLDAFSFRMAENPFFPNLNSMLMKKAETITEDTFISMQSLEECHRLEMQLIQSVSYGLNHKAELILSNLMQRQYMQYNTSSLQTLKNQLYTFNTVLRMAVLNASVHPLHTNQLSMEFTRKIDNITTTTDRHHFSKEMIRKYCLLVKNYSLKNYSKLIREVLTLIDFDLSADLGLKTIAETLNVNPCYLSSLFKKETGNTLTDYVNRKRIERAIFLLNSTNYQIQTIAQYCGISDVNYFTKKFKKLVGKTPKEYRDSISALL